MPLRRIYKPIEHTIRDWQHTLCSDGVGNTLIRQVLLLILPFGFSLQHVITFMECCQLQIDSQDDLAQISGYYKRTNPVDGR